MNRFISPWLFRKNQPRILRNNYYKFKVNPNIKQCYHYQALPILPLLQYLFRATVMISGRLINRWWRRLSAAEKSKIINRIKKNSKLILCTVTVTAGSTATLYYRNLEVSEITGRKRFMAISIDDLNYMLGEDGYKGLIEENDISLSDHPQYRFIKRIIETIVSRNKDKYSGLDREWKLVIVDNNDLINAACLPTGHVIVFTGLVNFVENDHQLAAVIAHEMSHILLEHGRESISRASLLSIVLSCSSFILWTFIPGDFTAFFSSWLKNRISKVFWELPYSRMLESEADVLGLTLIARACFKIEEAKRFWEIMDVFEKRNTNFMPDWLSTHPSSLLRAKLLEREMPEARKASEDCGCFKDYFHISKIIGLLGLLRIM